MLSAELELLCSLCSPALSDYPAKLCGPARRLFADEHPCPSIACKRRPFLDARPLPLSGYPVLEIPDILAGD